MTDKDPKGSFQSVRTANGYLLAEVASALQKSIRRGLLDDAAYWAVEMDLSGFAEYCWRRLNIITSEDVGAGWPEGPAVIAALYSSWQAAKGKRGGAGAVFLMDAIVRLCRAPKTRVADHIAAVHYTAHASLRREVPDYAFDMHTSRGRRMGRGIDHFLDEASVVASEANDTDVPSYKERERSLLATRRRAQVDDP